MSKYICECPDAMKCAINSRCSRTGGSFGPTTLPLNKPAGVSLEKITPAPVDPAPAKAG